jgi:1-acyl-sn-glycerol-3-phosphate acyltransferases
MRIAYAIYYLIAYPFVRFIFPCRFIGLENIPQGPLIVCANHTSLMDPVQIAIAFGIKRQLFFMAKAELFKIPVFGAILKSAGVFPIVRGETDITSIRTAIKRLKSGHQIMMFPEGTRVSEDELVAAKSGAVRIATKLKVPVLPIFISSGKKAFRCAKLVIGEPYMMENPVNKNYEPLSNELMGKIHALENKS